jgi:L,D-transpeptidase catalytic domain
MLPPQVFAGPIAVFLVLLLAPAEAPAQAHTKGRQVAPFTESLNAGDYSWHPELSKTGPVVIVASVPDQTLYVFRNGVRIGHSTISTGKSGKNTPTGVFTVLQKKVRHTSNIYKGAPMPHMQRLTWSGIAMHAGHLPGYPASAGCIRIPVDFAAKLYSVTNIGTTVVIADNSSAPKHTLQPGLLFSGKTGTNPTNNFTWDSAKAPAGPLSIIISTADRSIYVYRNGVEIGRAPAAGLNNFKLAGTFVYSADSKVDFAGHLDWVSFAGIGKKPPKLKALEDHFLVDRSFLQDVRSVIKPGTTLILTDMPVSRQTMSGPDFNILTASEN